MNQTLDIQEFSIVLVARNHNPTLVTPDFLRGSGVIPEDWELARPPALSTQTTQIIFKNGIKIEAQAGTISFSQAINPQSLNTIELPSLARRYSMTLPNLAYQGVGINPRRFVTFRDGADQAHQYITETILARGSWQHFGIAPIQAGINLVYTLERCQLRLAINEARLQMPDAEAIPAVLFVGNFNYRVIGEAADERLKFLHQAIDNWQVDLETYRELIEHKFLVRAKSEDIVSIRDAS
ncbi:MAG TPA: hypothetical protein DD379_05310 [Cyanobacteria bacterium UBA11162]|nr:hypothetical protein [Cyanobacteria bacterium UBA11162]